VFLCSASLLLFRQWVWILGCAFACIVVFPLASCFSYSKNFNRTTNNIRSCVGHDFHQPLDGNGWSIFSPKQIVAHITVDVLVVAHKKANGRPLGELIRTPLLRREFNTLAFGIFSPKRYGNKCRTAPFYADKSNLNWWFFDSRNGHCLFAVGLNIRSSHTFQAFSQRWKDHACKSICGGVNGPLLRCCFGGHALDVNFSDLGSGKTRRRKGRCGTEWHDLTDKASAYNLTALPHSTEAIGGNNDLDRRPSNHNSCLPRYSPREHHEQQRDQVVWVRKRTIGEGPYISAYDPAKKAITESVDSLDLDVSYDGKTWFHLLGPACLDRLPNYGDVNKQKAR